MPNTATLPILPVLYLCNNSQTFLTCWPFFDMPTFTENKVMFSLFALGYSNEA